MVQGPTNVALTTSNPCIDKYTNCAAFAGDNWYKSCGLCPVMNPHNAMTESNILRANDVLFQLPEKDVN